MDSGLLNSDINFSVVLIGVLVIIFLFFALVLDEESVTGMCFPPWLEILYFILFISTCHSSKLVVI